ncbi:MAG: hypothetical protein IJP23_06960 [Oscillospiraceae bacterium]|nr:hypothetical protein [Oscillospiraceae bacterium]
MKKQKEGRKLKYINPMDRVQNFIMPEKSVASNFYKDTLDIGPAETYIKRKREEGLKGFGLLHVFLASYVRTISQRPGLNRYIRGQKTWARNGVEISMVVKKELKLDAPETVIKLFLKPDCTADDIYHSIMEKIEEGRQEGDNNGLDKAARALNYIPGLVLKIAVWLIKLLDYFNLLPRFLTRLSPFHASMFITSMGSLGLQPIYHHLYDLGNLPVFVALGAKNKDYVLDRHGNVNERRSVDFTAVLDERIADGQYYASCFKLIKHYFTHPDQLDNPPEKVVEEVR